MTISAPGVDRAIGSQSHAVEVAGGNGDDVFEVPTPPGPKTSMGVKLLVVVPFPNSPNWLSPQAQTVPSALSKSVCQPEGPAETAMMLLPVFMGTGLFSWLTVLPTPSCPKSL